MRTFKPFLMAAFVAVTAFAQRAIHLDPESDVKVAFRKGAVVVTVPEGAHLKKGFMAVTLKSKPGAIKAGPLPATTGVDELGDPIWHGSVRIPVMGESLAGEAVLEVQYQPCTEGEGGVCYPPTSQTLKVKASEIPAAKTAPTTAEAKAETPQEPPATAPKAGAPAAQAIPAPAPAPKRGLTELVWALLAAFGWGLAASLTPCVYPMIPITMAIVGAKGSGRLRGFLLSLTLVLGMAATYTVFGVVAGLSGNAFGAFAQRPAFLIPVSALFALFALSLFGAFEIQLPQSIQMKLQGNGPRQGFGGAFIMGLVLGPLAAPCVGPFVGTVLVNIAKHSGIVSGASQLFVFALGMGVLFMIVGTFSSGLPKSGGWLIRFKQIMGLVVLGFAAWNLRLIVPEWANFAMWAVTTLTGAAVFGLFEAADGLLPQVRKAFAILLVVLGIVLGVRAAESALNVPLLPRAGAAVAVESAPKAWLEQDLEGALARAKAENKMVLVDIYADWCAQCKELDEKTWPDPAVKAWIAKNAIAVRIDTDKRRPDLAKRLEIRSYPTVILLEGSGQELRRSLGFTKPEGMLAWLEDRK